MRIDSEYAKLQVGNMCPNGHSDMNELSLSESEAESIANKLKSIGYSANPRKVYTSFSKGLGDRTFLHYSLNIIRATKNTEGEVVIQEFFGDPNGRASESQNGKYSTWFFNGYLGKAGTKQY